MGCGCLVALASVISPRLALFLLWLFTDRLTIAFESGWIGLAGFFFLPWTSLAYAVAFMPGPGVGGFGWFLVGFAFLVDLGSYFSSADARRRQAYA
ncbi:MAG: hypothetical protein JJU45_05415 [Acidimicrobiia bacterium]|nr:hypothetical protein [Acidimicrobiia bacterium]